MANPIKILGPAFIHAGPFNCQQCRFLTGASVYNRHTSDLECLLFLQPLRRTETTPLRCDACLKAERAGK